MYIIHLHKSLDCFKKNNIVIFKKKIELLKQKKQTFRTKNRQRNIDLQPHIVSKILEFQDKIEDTKEL